MGEDAMPDKQTGSGGVPGAGARWLLLLVFPLFAGGFLLANLGQGPAIAVVLASLASAWLFAHIGRPVSHTLWVWIIWLLFLAGYAAKTLVMALLIPTPDLVVTLMNPEWRWVTAADLADGVYWWAAAFACFCLVAGPAVEWWPARTMEDPGAVYLARARTLLFALVATSLVLQATRVHLDIGIMGIVQEHRLPFRLDTLLFRSQSTLVPALLLLTVWVFDTTRTRGLWLAAVGALLLHFVMLSLIMTSRAGLVNFALLLVLLWAVTRRLPKRAIILASVGVPALLLFIPFMTAVRAARLTAGEGAAEALVSAVQAFGEADIAGTALRTMLHVQVRVTGADGVWFVQRRVLKAGLSDFPSGIPIEGPVGLFYTRDVTEITIAGDFRSPGIVGSLMLMGGIWGPTLLFALFVGAVGVWWRALLYLRTGPVAMAVSGAILTVFVMEGLWQVPDLVTGMATVGVVELVHRWWLLAPVPNGLEGARPVTAQGPAAE
jgi:hypothetical protein